MSAIVKPERLLLVHAHPDDECLSTGGIMAAYAPTRHVCLVTCTNGELGEIAEVPDLGTQDEIRPRLGEIRLNELRSACDALGVSDIRLLGYHDSGMDGTPDNQRPDVFINQDFDEVVARVVSVVREVRPQVMVTYNEFGFYGHPDHIRAHLAAVAAFDKAADSGYDGDDGQPWTVSKLYYNAVPLSGMLSVREGMLASGAPEEQVFSLEAIKQIATPDEELSAAVDVSRYVPAKIAALQAHRTQYGTTKTFLDMPEGARNLLLSTEFFVLGRTRVGKPTRTESDLFERVDGS